MIAHVVLFQPKPGVVSEHGTELLSAIQEATAQIKDVQVARVGKVVSLGLMPQTVGQQTYQFGAVFEFADKDALERYLKHQAHDRVREVFWRLCEATLIADLELVDTDHRAGKYLGL